MSTLDNIMTGRFTHMKSGILSQVLWKGVAEKEEYENREIVEKVIDFLEIQSIRKTEVGITLTSREKYMKKIRDGLAFGDRFLPKEHASHLVTLRLECHFY